MGHNWIQLLQPPHQARGRAAGGARAEEDADVAQQALSVLIRTASTFTAASAAAASALDPAAGSPTTTATPGRGWCDERGRAGEGVPLSNALQQRLRP
jgi:hypothetical protein